MNILYIHTHDSGRMVSPYGVNAPTDNLLAFARDAAVFTQAYCAGPTCSPSRAALLTGTYPHQNGMLGLAQRGFGLTDYRRHLAQFLGRHGYHTVLCGIQHESGWYLDADAPGKLGYNEVLTASANPSKKEDLHLWDAVNADHVCQWLDQAKADEPFFLSYGMHSTHRPYPVEICEAVDERYVRPPFPIDDNGETRHDQAQFLTSAYYMDQNFGKVIDKLKETGLMEKTIVMFTTDHGVALPFNKCNLTDSGIGVSLIMRVPGAKANGQVIDALVSHVDVMPTLCDLLQLEKPDYLEGTSFAEVFENISAEPVSEIFAEVNFHTSYEPIRCVRTRRYKYIRYYDESWTKLNLSNMDSSASKDFYMRNDLATQTKDTEALYDCYYDPDERKNLAQDPRYQEILEDLREKLRAFQIRTQDPILHGELEMKPEYKVNKKECVNASSKDPQDYDPRGRWQ